MNRQYLHTYIAGLPVGPVHWAAEAEAKSLELIAAALKDKPDLLTYQYIVKLSPNIQVMLLPSNAPFLFPLPNSNNTGANALPYATYTPVVPTPVVPAPVVPTPAPTPTPTQAP